MSSVLVVVGTDHHPFARAVEWADRWAQAHPDDQVTVQHGSSAPPARARGVAVVAPAELDGLMRGADVVITHGGPGTISAARAAGHVPLILPRDPSHGEHVDDHQMRFSAWADEHGLGSRADLGTLDERVARALGSGGTRRDLEQDDAQVAASVQRMVTLLGSPASRSVAADAPTVLYLGGFGRSGSTLLERMLGTIDGVVPLGEVVHLWERGLVDNELCGCGEPFSDCPFWTRVGETAFGGWRNVDLAQVRRLRQAVDRQRRAPLTLLPSPPLAVRKDLARYTDLYRRVYQAAVDVSGARVVVDSSKHASLAIALEHDRHIDLRVLHVVRDPRAVAHSWAREIARPESRPGTSMPRLSPANASGQWLSNNLLVDALRLTGLPVHLLRYEELVTAPQETVDAAWQGLRLPGPSRMRMLDATTLDLEPIHSVAGNPMRFRHGPTPLRPDDAWRQHMPSGDRRAVSAMTAPLRWRLGYRGVL